VKDEDEDEYIPEAEGSQEGQTATETNQLIFKWFFVDEEEKFDQLFESFNLKGIREKKLVESLKKIRQSIKMKKSKKAKAEEEAANESKDAIGNNDEKKSVNDEDQNMEDDEEEA
jgi:hypothetical protein